jgi:glycosyltransferase involved in cell wall biosynthesis
MGDDDDDRRSSSSSAATKRSDRDSGARGGSSSYDDEEVEAEADVEMDAEAEVDIEVEAGVDVNDGAIVVKGGGDNDDDTVADDAETDTYDVAKVLDFTCDDNSPFMKPQPVASSTPSAPPVSSSIPAATLTLTCLEIYATKLIDLLASDSTNTNSSSSTEPSVGLITRQDDAPTVSLRNCVAVPVSDAVRAVCTCLCVPIHPYLILFLIVSIYIFLSCIAFCSFYCSASNVSSYYSLYPTQHQLLPVSLHRNAGTSQSTSIRFYFCDATSHIHHYVPVLFITLSFFFLL